MRRESLTTSSCFDNPDFGRHTFNFCYCLELYFGYVLANVLFAR